MRQLNLTRRPSTSGSLNVLNVSPETALTVNILICCAGYMKCSRQSMLVRYGRNRMSWSIGSYDSFRDGCLGDEFYDGMHPKLECMSKVFSEAR